MTVESVMSIIAKKMLSWSALLGLRSWASTYHHHPAHVDHNEPLPAQERQHMMGGGWCPPSSPLLHFTSDISGLLDWVPGPGPSVIILPGQWRHSVTLCTSQIYLTKIAINKDQVSQQVFWGNHILLFLQPFSSQSSRRPSKTGHFHSFLGSLSGWKNCYVGSDQQI